ncbi:MULTISPECIES: queuosine precursor transporter [Chlamydia]|uniref:Queuosine precursor transporter n=1 Tax=Chlamydia crocodili TaxID=2766982 RepID=A0ABX8CHP7_9CHLA|nr:queuosine precursor transporter [Chlamydia crocodili]QVE49112.1 queuosine precursor transporter [Chlamydia crocodili]
MHNEMIFIAQTVLIVLAGIFFASKSTGWLTGWLATLSVIMNVFVLKQIFLCGLEVTSADVYMIGILSCLNFSRELYGQNKVNEAMIGSWVITIAFLILTQLHLALIPSLNDATQHHFIALFSPTLRLTLASLVTVILVQIVDLKLFSYLKSLFQDKAFGTRSAISLISSQVLDTLLFSFLGLYGIVSNLTHVILFSLITKICVITMSVPVVVLGKYFRKRKEA